MDIKAIQIIAGILVILSISLGGVFAYTNQSYFPRAKGEVVQAQVCELMKVVTEIRSDVKTLIRGQK